MSKYFHKINYYETDKMGVVHHSNYIRWMEEARIHFLEEIGFGYDKLESDGIISPVIYAECDYKTPSTFGDTVLIEVEIEEFKGVKLIMKYTMTNVKTGELVLIGRTKHCFVNDEGKPLILKKDFPEFDKKLKELIKRD